MAAGSSKPVMVVEDDPSLLRVIELVLKDGGYETVTASDGMQALQKVDGDLPGAIVLDMQMPVMNGWEFARILRERFGNSIPIIMLTAAVDAQQRAAEINADAYLDKPFDIDELVSVVGRYYTGG